jgi:hypothetical protein
VCLTLTYPLSPRDKNQTAKIISKKVMASDEAVEVRMLLHHN